MLIGSLSDIYDIFMRAREENEPVIFPTDTIYGIGAPITDKTANQKIYEIKGREKNKPFPVLVSSIEQATELADISEDLIDTAKKLWNSGSVTLILKAKPHIDSLYTLNGNIALRIPNDVSLKKLIEKTGALSATSANLSGVEYNGDDTFIVENFKSLIKFFIIKRTYALNPSVIIDLTSDTPKIVRGEINLHEILSDNRK